MDYHLKLVVFWKIPQSSFRGQVVHSVLLNIFLFTHTGITISQCKMHHTVGAKQLVYSDRYLGRRLFTEPSRNLFSILSFILSQLVYFAVVILMTSSHRKKVLTDSQHDSVALICFLWYLQTYLSSTFLHLLTENKNSSFASQNFYISMHLL